VPINCPLEVLKTCNVALELVLVASTRSLRLSRSYSARVMETRSAVEVAGVMVSVAVRVTPPSVALMVALVVEVTAVVLTLKVAEDEPAGTVTLAGSVARALLLARLTVVAADAVALRVTRPCDVPPPVTELGVKVTEETVRVGAGVGVGVGVAAGVTVSETERLPIRVLETVMLTLRVEVTLRVLTLKRTFELPAGMKALEGTVATVVLLLDTENWRPPLGATAPEARLTVTCAAEPPTTLEGETVTLP
jgi:hypothetical protein